MDRQSRGQQIRSNKTVSSVTIFMLYGDANCIVQFGFRKI